MTFYYEEGEVPALKEVTLQFEKGLIYSIIGPNGAGKSTLLRLLNGLIPHFYQGEMKGKVLVDGIDTREATVAQLARKVGLVFQNPEHMFFSETVFDEVAFGPKSLGYSQDEVNRLVRSSLEIVGLWELRNRSPWSLSGGEKKRLSIASVLAMNTDYLAIDEPTIGQDHVSQMNLISLFRRIRDGGRSVIVVTHDLEWLEDLKPDVVILMVNGSIVKVGELDMLLDVRLLARNKMFPPIAAIVKYLVGEK